MPMPDKSKSGYKVTQYEEIYPRAVEASRQMAYLRLKQAPTRLDVAMAICKALEFDDPAILDIGVISVESLLCVLEAILQKLDPQLVDS